MDKLLAPVSRYYTEKIERYGAQPQGADWNGHEGQVLRFEQLCKVLPADARFSVTDVGCGYGALLDYLQANYRAFDYVGVDISEAMLVAAAQRHEGIAHARFVLGSEPPQPSDFAVASGIFNVKLGSDEAAWRGYMEATIESMNRFSLHGFTFNCLSGYSDQHKMRPDLHYADPCELFDLCKRRYSRHVSLLHDYGLYEFTIIVRK
jgi:SAM-dependent methyltransferase